MNFFIGLKIAAVFFQIAIAVKQNHPLCDISVDNAVCLRDGERILLPNARVYGMVLNLTFDGTSPVDDSGLQNHGKGDFFPASGVGGFGSSAMMRQNFVAVPSSPDFETSDFSYTFNIFRLEDEKSIENNNMHDQYCPIIHKGTMSDDVAEAAPAILINPKDGRLKIVIGTTTSVGTAGEEMVSNFTLSLGQWYHVAVVRHTTKLRLYVDGVLDSTLTTEGPTRTNDLPLYVGCTDYAKDLCDVPILLDNVRVYQVAIGRHQIQADASITAPMEPSFIHISCTNCGRAEAAAACPSSYHPCSRLELYSGVYQMMRKLGVLDHNIIDQSDMDSASGFGICCADA